MNNNDEGKALTYTVAAIRHPRRRSYHASLPCAKAATRASDATLHVCTQSMARHEERWPCALCWSPEGYVVVPELT